MQYLLIMCLSESSISKNDLVAAINSLSRIITLDIDLALTVYTRTMWAEAANASGAVFL